LDGCSSLQQLSVSRLEDDVKEWLNKGGQSVQELIITHHYGMYDRALDHFNGLVLPELTTLFVREWAVEKRTSEDVEVWSDADTWATGMTDEESTDLDSGESDSADTISADSNLPGSDPSDSDTLDSDEIDPENPTPILEQLDKSTLSVLDRLHDRGSKLKRLSLCLDLETQFVSLGPPSTSLP
jgi:hypothetical protein